MAGMEASNRTPLETVCRTTAPFIVLFGTHESLPTIVTDIDIDCRPHQTGHLGAVISFGDSMFSSCHMPRTEPGAPGEVLVHIELDARAQE